MTQEAKQSLICAAIAARDNAYAPYSHFAVGAALLCSDGTVYTGCNIETAAFNGVCAERTALYKAVSEGARAFAALCVVGGRVNGALGITSPCGVCRQSLIEFCRAEMPIIMATDETHFEEQTLGALLPMSFGPDNLQ